MYLVFIGTLTFFAFVFYAFKKINKRFRVKSTKLFVTPESLRKDSFLLASKVFKDKFKPDIIITIWRGGSFIGICVHEFYKYKNIQSEPVVIRTARYTGIDETKSTVTVDNLEYLLANLTVSSKVLLVDDVYDTGLSIRAVLDTLKEKLGDKMPNDIRIATPYYKPERNQTSRIPEYYIYETDRWIVFPHELEGLTLDEISQGMGSDIAEIIDGN